MMLKTNAQNRLLSAGWKNSVERSAGSRAVRRFLMTAVLLSCSTIAVAATPPTDGEALRQELRQHYPSLAWVERYRQAFPAEVQGNSDLWRAAVPPALDSYANILTALVPLQDQHVALVDINNGKQEALGVLFRTSSDGALVVWRHIDPLMTALIDGEQITDVDGQPVKLWLENAANQTFGGNRRSRMAEAALKLAVATPADHAAAGLNREVRFGVVGKDGKHRAVTLRYQPVTAQTGAALAHAVERSDLPDIVQAHGYRVGIVRFGAFAPQYDSVFNDAAEAAAKHDTSDDGPMLAGYCAVVRERLARINDIAARSDVLLVDLRGNMGGFAREARLLTRALTDQPLPTTYDVFPGSQPGRLKLVKQVEDPSCGTVTKPHALIVWVDGGTRSRGEFMATWLWAAGALTVGERTVGAGGGRDAGSTGFRLPHSSISVKYSGNFSVFETGTRLSIGEIPESTLIDIVAQGEFAASRARPFAIQAVGLQPDVMLPTTAADLADGGADAVRRAIGQLVQQKLMPPR
jgi:hypothetical protein